MKKIIYISLIILIGSVIFFSFTENIRAVDGEEIADYICNDETKIFDGHNADWWCTHDEPGCSEQSYHFCITEFIEGEEKVRHYYFGCSGVAGCNCNPDPSKTGYDECLACVPWTCEKGKGCRDGECIPPFKDCPGDYCCTADDPEFKTKLCPLSGQECVDHKCVAKECLYQCCIDDPAGYKNKKCEEVGGKKYYCEEHVCLEQPDVLLDCPFPCCESIEGFKDKLCEGEGKECISNECVAPESEIPVLDGSKSIVGPTCPPFLTLNNPNTYQADDSIIAYKGLVPCGTCGLKDPETDADGNLILDGEGNTIGGTPIYIPCQFCHFFVMFDGIVDFVLFKIIPPFAVLMLVIGGLMFIFAYFGGAEVLPGGTQGGPALLNRAKKLISSVVIGLIIIFAAWLIINSLLMFLNLSDFAIDLGIGPGEWSQIPCTIHLPK